MGADLVKLRDQQYLEWVCCIIEYVLQNYLFLSPKIFFISRDSFDGLYGNMVSTIVQESRIIIFKFNRPEFKTKILFFSKFLTIFQNKFVIKEKFCHGINFRKNQEYQAQKHFTDPYNKVVINTKNLPIIEDTKPTPSVKAEIIVKAM